MITNIRVIFVVHSLIQLNCNGCVCENCSKLSVSAVNGKISFLKPVRVAKLREICKVKSKD